MNSKNYVFTDSDLDGVGSLMVLEWLLGETPYKTTTHKNFREDFLNFLTNNKISEYDNIYICDLNVSGHSDILNYNNITVIDHHNGKDNYVNFGKPQLILDSNYPSTTKLVLKHLLCKDKSISSKLNKQKAKLIEIVNDYDSYKLALKESIGLNQVLWSYTGNRVQKFVEEFKEGFKEFTLFQKNMITLANRKIKSFLQECDVFTLTTNIDGNQKKIISCMCDHNINEVASGLLKIHKADIVFIINCKSKSVSFRKKPGEKTNLNKLASKLCNGGGHTDSAGGKINETLLKFTKLFKPAGL